MGWWSIQAYWPSRIRRTLAVMAPQPTGPSSHAQPRDARTPPARGRGGLAGVRPLLPGLALVVMAVAVALGVHRLVPALSPLLVAILLGAVLANAVALPARVAPGLALAARKLLRSGVVLLGLQLLLGDILGLGAGMIVVVVCVVVGGLLGTVGIGALLGLAPTQRLLIACGFSICGAAAVAAVDGVVDAEEEEVVTAIALVVLFGTLMIPVVPLLVRALDLGDHLGGLWAGASIHEVAQVVAAGGAIGGSALAVAVVVKLARVLMLAPVMAVISAQRRRRSAGGDTGVRPPLVPLFVVGFVAMVGVRSTGVLPVEVLSVAGTVQSALLAAAMFALGCGVRITALRQVGPRPFLLALLSTLLIGSLALGGVLLLG